MSRYWHRFTCATMLWVALNPLAASAQTQPDPSSRVSVCAPFAAAGILDESEWIYPGYLHCEPFEQKRKESLKPLPWTTTPPDDTDLKGATRDTAYFFVYQTIVVGLLYAAPESISGWSDESKDDHSSNTWEDNVRNPHRDSDDFAVNYLLHPYWGATYYTRGRERGFTRTQSFLFSATLSTLFEFGLEALFEQPSYQDLWVTPVLGSLLGEHWFTHVRSRIKARPGELNWKDKTILFFTDPLGVLSAGTDRLLGLDTKIQLHTFHTGNAPRFPGHADASNMTSLSWTPGRTRPVLGLRLRVSW